MSQLTDKPATPAPTAQFFIRISAFLRKEIFEMIRQPVLVLSLILGPFLILLFFGIGFRNDARPLRTLFVASADNPITSQIEHYASTLGAQLVYTGIITDLAMAQQSLNRDQIDLIVTVPDNAYQNILNNQQAVFTLYHHEIDPFQVDYVAIFGRVYVDEINRRVLKAITTAGQTNATQAEPKLTAARSSIVSLQILLGDCSNALSQPNGTARCDSRAARDYIKTFNRQIDQIDQNLGDDMQLVDTIHQQLQPAANPADNQPASQTLSELIDTSQQLTDLQDTADSYVTNLQLLTQLQKDLDSLQGYLDEFLRLKPAIIVSPFKSEAKNIAPVITQPAHYFAPAVIVLLLQHLAITFAALSMVREQQLGTLELFYVAPLSAIEILLGKYLSYLLFCGFVAVVLFVLVVAAMGVPMLGNWLSVGAVVAALVFASLGVGFVISMLSKTDTQAVQYSMIVLLTSVFFSGFIVGLSSLTQPVRSISWAVPATYGTYLLREIMLRGAPVNLNWLGGLFTIGLGLFVGSWFLLRRSMLHSGN